MAITWTIRTGGLISSRPSSTSSSIGNSSPAISPTPANSARQADQQPALRLELDKRRGNAALFCEEDIVGAARRASVHRIDDDAAGAQSLAERERNRAHARAAAQQQDLDVAARDHRREALERRIAQIGDRPGSGGIAEDKD